MKVIFLDFDGVLNTNGWGRHVTSAPEKWAERHPYVWIDKDLCERFASLFDDPKFADVKIVISSTWRVTFQLPELKEILNDMVKGLGDRVIDVTKQLSELHHGLRVRGKEVADWLANAPEKVEAYAIIDDNDWFTPGQWPKFVYTEAFTGLSTGNVEQLKRILEDGYNS